MNNQQKKDAKASELSELLAELNDLEELRNKAERRLQFGRHYLMSVDPKRLTVEDALEAFGFSRNGLNG